MIACVIPEAPRHLLQYDVANVMPVSIIHGLEVIEVDNHQPDGPVNTVELDQIFLQRLVEITPVLHARQAVRQRSMFEGLRPLGKILRDDLQLAAIQRIDSYLGVDQEQPASERRRQQPDRDVVQLVQPRNQFQGAPLKR